MWRKGLFNGVSASTRPFSIPPRNTHTCFSTRLRNQGPFVWGTFCPAARHFSAFDRPFFRPLPFPSRDRGIFEAAQHVFKGFFLASKLPYSRQDLHRKQTNRKSNTHQLVLDSDNFFLHLRRSWPFDDD